MGDIGILIIGVVDTFFAFFVVAPMMLQAASLFGVQKQFAKAMVEEGVVTQETVDRIHPKKQIAGVVISLLVLAVLAFTCTKASPWGYICGGVGLVVGLLKYRTIVQYNSDTVKRFKNTYKDEMDVKVNMPGEFSVYNALAALAVGKVLGLPDQAIHDGLGKCVVKGRVELVPISKKFTILLDYAHNEVSTESLLTTLRAYKPHRLVVVFGCGGNRSKLRRYGMGEICAKMADFSILTEDNNRFEKVEDILADIRVGMNKGNPDAKFVEIPDRLDALHYAVDHAQEGDLIAVIGKGHETYRDREGVKTPFLERELLEEYAQQIGLE